MCTPTLEDQNFSPESVFTTAFPDGSSPLAAMDNDQKPVHGGDSSLPFSAAGSLYGQSAAPSPDGSSLESLVIDAPAGTLANSSAEPSSSLDSPKLPPPLESLDEASPFSRGEYLHRDYSYRRSATRRWWAGWSPQREKSPESPTMFSPPSDDDEDSSEDPLWLRYPRPASPFRMPELSPYRWSSFRSYSPEKRPSYSDYLFSTDEAEMEPTGVGAGLRNLGNTCFLNVVLQCFTHTVPFVQALHSFNHPRPCERSRQGFCVLCLLIDHIEKALSSSGRTIAPEDLFDKLSNISSSFRRYQQEDAHEFLQCLLDRLDSCCLDSETDDDMSPQNNKLVEQVFGGRLVSKLRCCNCGHISNTYEPLIDLSLEIEDVDSLPSALESFTKVERIEDAETQFTCENCKEAVSVDKQLVLDQAPSVAAFHLKRFKAVGSSVFKIDKHVEYPLELDLRPYTCGNHDNVELNYDLYAVVVHVGSTPSSGHYFCFVRSSPETWHRLDDSRVREVQTDVVLSQDAYILFYVRKGTPWFSSSLESLKSFLAPCISNQSPKSVLDNAESTLCSSGPNRDSCEDNETRDASDGSSTEKHEVDDINISIEMQDDASVGISTGRHEEVEVNVTVEASEGLLVNESGCDSLVIDTSMASVASSSCGETSNNYEKISTSLSNANSGISDTVKSDIICPISPSPINSSDGCYIIPLDHLRSEKQHTCKRAEEQHTCKRQLSMSLKNSKKREACSSNLNRSGGPRTRHMTLAAAVNGNNEVKRKKKRMEAYSIKVGPRGIRHKPRRMSRAH